MIEQGEGCVRLQVKAVPGASRDVAAGVLGDRLKIRISAPPEGGKANKAICALLADRLGVRSGAVSIESGATHAEKVIRIDGVDEAQVRSSLGL